MELGNRLREPAPRGQDFGQITTRFGIARLALQYPLKRLYRLVEATALGQRDAEVLASGYKGRRGRHGTLQFGNGLVVMVLKILIGPRGRKVPQPNRRRRIHAGPHAAEQDSHQGAQANRRPHRILHLAGNPCGAHRRNLTDATP